MRTEILAGRGYEADMGKRACLTEAEQSHPHRKARRFSASSESSPVEVEIEGIGVLRNPVVTEA
jgi:hypothetical protein